MLNLLSLLQGIQAIIIPNVAVVQDAALAQLPATGTIGGASFFVLVCDSDDAREIQTPTGVDFLGATVRLRIDNVSGGVLSATTFAAGFNFDSPPGFPADNERTYYEFTFNGTSWDGFAGNPIPIP